MITGHIQNTRTITGHIKNVSGITGTISKPSGHAQSDHQFVIVDLVKLQAQMLAVNGVTAIVPFTASITQVIPKDLMINLSTDILTVSSMTATIDLVTATIDEGVYTNVNE